MNENRTENHTFDRTAFLVSEMRAREAECSPRLFDDPYARFFSTSEAVAILARIGGLVPTFVPSARARTRFFDDVLCRALDGGTAQVLNLGAGFDCRALRFPRAGVRYFEVDGAGLLAFKTERLAAAGHPRGAVAVCADYHAPDLVATLAAYGFDPALPTLALWEGNSFYQEAPAVPRLLGTLARAIPRLRIAFDYFEPIVIESGGRARGMTAALAALRAQGAPFCTGIADAGALAREVGLRVEEDTPMEALLARLLPEMDLAAEPPPESHLCVLASDAAPARRSRSSERAARAAV